MIGILLLYHFYIFLHKFLNIGIIRFIIRDSEKIRKKAESLPGAGDSLKNLTNPIPSRASAINSTTDLKEKILQENIARQGYCQQISRGINQAYFLSNSIELIRLFLPIKIFLPLHFTVFFKNGTGYIRKRRISL